MQGGTIGFFDSGVGGLTLLRECARRMPGENFVYFGDNENAPYGNRPESEIRAFAFRAFDLFARMPVRAAVIACNTVTALCADDLRAAYPFPVVGVEPAVRPAAERGGKVLLLATRATLSSGRVRRLIGANAAKAEIIPFCPARLAGEIEKNIFDLSAVRLEEHLPRGRFDAVVLGCTHYIFLRGRIAVFYGCPVFDGNAGTADHLAKILNICSQNGGVLGQKLPVFCGKCKKFNKNVYNTLR